MVRWCLLVSMVFLTLAAAVVHGIEPIADPIGWSTLAYPESGPCMQWRAEYLAKRATQQQLFVDLLASDGKIVTLTADVESSQAIFDAFKADWQAVFNDPTATQAEKNLAQSLMNSAANVLADAKAALSQEQVKNQALRLQLNAITGQINNLKALLDANCGGTNGQ